MKHAQQDENPHFDPSKARWLQANETFVVNLVKPGTGKAFTRKCRETGLRNYVAIERLIEGWVDGRFTL